MKEIILSWCLTFLAIPVFAQKGKTWIISKDTINLRGFVYKADGKPAVNAVVMSKQLDFIHNLYPLTVKTDINGYFEIKGAMPQDTLLIDHDTWVTVKVMNKGSRYLVVYLPAENVFDLNSKTPITVNATAKQPKRIPSFKIIPTDGIALIDAVEMIPEYPGGKERLFKYIQDRLIYPENAVKHHIEGTVEVSFRVEKDGTLTDFKILKGIGYGCDEQLIEILKHSNKWKPGIKSNQAATAIETVSVQFKLTDK